MHIGVITPPVPGHLHPFGALGRELIASDPTWIVDGLGPLNPALAIANFPDLREWLGNYREFGRTRFSIIYKLK